jgi:tripartite-type tricarboxylate transporter receptor subunit TctC
MLGHVQLQHIPFKSTPEAINAALAGEVSMTFASAPTAMSQVKAGKLKALGVTTERPISSLPDVPPLAAQGLHGFDVYAWFGLAAPAGTAEPIIQRLNHETLAVLAMPEVREKFSSLGMEALGSTPAEFGTFIRSEIKRLGEVVRASGASNK